MQNNNKKNPRNLFCTLAEGLSKVFGIGYSVRPRITYHDLKSIDDLKAHHTLLPANENRVGYYCYNQSAEIILVAAGTEPATEEHHTTQIAANSGFPSPSPDQTPYKGEVTFNPVAATSGSIVVTEYVLVKNR